MTGGAVDDPARRAALPTVAVVGRPNVGKSTLVNRIVGRREAIVEEQPGVTRDRKEVVASWTGHEFVLVDTGGWLAGGDALERKVSDQAARAIGEADAVLFVLDATVGVTDEDDRAAQVVRRSGRPVVVVANKVDNASLEAAIWEAVSLGLGDPFAVSALHGRGTGDLLDALVALLPAPEVAELAGAGEGEDEGEGEESGDDMPAVVIIGRPNVGKSTLFNRLAGDDRAIVHDLPGTTRDSIDTVVETDAGPIRLVDTAGMRRKSRVTDGTERFGNVRTLRAVERVDVALLVIDAVEGVTHQDQRLAERVDAAGCPVVVLLNKWDLVDGEGREQALLSVQHRLRFLEYSPVLRVSAARGKGVHRLGAAIDQAVGDYRRRVPTAELNRVVRGAQARHPAPAGGRVLYATQGATDPPTITLFTNKEVPKSWLRYLERSIREDLQMGSTPVKLRVRRRSE